MYVLQSWLILCLTVSLTGARLDVTFFNGRATPSFSGNLFIAGFSAGDAIPTVGTSFTFGRILDTDTGSDLPIQRYENFKSYSRRLHLHDGVDRPGVYYCDANANTGETERLQTVLVAEEAEIKPEIQTKTVSWGDDTTLTMTTSVSASSLKWRHNGIQKSEWNGQSSITISFAKTSDAGIYECYSSAAQRNQGKHGFMRLIVRGCSNGKWGLPDCLSSCPTCYNGGMCNSDTGECICPPGFQGSNCETGCGKNSWGMTCGRKCSSSNSDACRRTMYCIADPYGCSCSASYGGLDCATDCPRGMYGSGCTQTCHCVNGCNGATGECNNGGCEQGWSGSKCHIPDSCPGGFYGELCNYKCHCKDNAACDKATGWCPNGECAPGWINVFLDCQQDGSLKIWALYNVKVNPGEETSIICEVGRNPFVSPDDVTLVDQSGSEITRTSFNSRGRYILLTNYSSSADGDRLPYTCRVGDQTKQLTTLETYVLPQFSPINRPDLSQRATRITVTWKKWENGTDLGDGPVVSYKVYFKKTTDTDWTAHQHFPVIDQDQTSYTTDITGLVWSTSYDFTVTVKRPGPLGEGSKGTYSTVSTMCDVPSEGPTITGTTSNHPNALQVSLLVPDPSKIKCDNVGFIENFLLRYRRANTQDEYIEVAVTDGSSREFIVAGLHAFTEYELMLSFNNRDEQSPWSSVYKARTAEDVPSKPRNIILKPAVFTIQVEWSIPYPANGIITKYVIVYWETDNQATSKERQVTENLQDVNMYLLTNLTYKLSYTVQVAAYTAPGQGEFSDTVSATTAEAIPEKPRSVEVIDAKDTEIKLTWTAPFPFAGEVTHYGISYKSIDSVFENTELQFESFFVQGSVSDYTLEDLSPGTIYEIKVNASTRIGVGEATAFLTGTTFTVDISSVLPMTEDIKNDMHHYGSITLVSLPILSEDANISKETSLIYYVIVLEYDQTSKRRRKRSIDTSRLGEYDETGPPYYITALLPLSGLPQKFAIGDGGIYGGYTNVPLTIGRQYGVYYGLKSEINGEPVYYFDESHSIRFTAGVKENMCHCSSTAIIIVSLIALVLILCLVLALVFTIRRQNPQKGRNEHEEVRLGKMSNKPQRKDDKDISRHELKGKQDKPQEGVPDDSHQYAYVNVSTPQSTDLTGTSKYQERQKHNDERLYTGLVKEPQSESEYTSLSTSTRNTDIKY
ncbi:angiopoietin-1 receptor-like [Ptychodera flava]|uniref:angiopoietin-1 receptor-like n=1 Tax=Ptychodera flava TaxID=63121 RepID=UPI00396A1C65